MLSGGSKSRGAWSPEHEQGTDSMALRIERRRRVEDGGAAVESDRISWGAILAGAICALALQIIFTLMTAGMGLSLASEGEGPGFGAGLFFAVTAIASMFAGGSIAGRLSGEPGLPSAALHGVVVWALVLIAVAWLGVSATGAALRGAGATVQATGQTLGSAAGGAGSAVADAVSAVAPDMDELEAIDVEELLPASVEEDLRALSGNPNLSADSIRRQGREILNAVVDEEDLTEARDIAIGAGREMLRNPGEAGAIFDAAAAEMTAPDGPLGENQFDELQGVLADRYGVTPGESQEIADRWRAEFVEARDAAVAAYRDAYDSAAETVNEAVDAAAEAARQAAETASSVAWWSAIGGFLGLLAAAIGAAFARPEDIVSDRVVTRAPQP